MRVVRIEHQRYRVPFRAPFTTSHGTERERRGLLLRVTTEDGLSGLGEAAPLPAFGTGSVDDSQRWIGTLGAQLTDRDLADLPEILDGCAGEPEAAPACFAFDTAALDIEASVADLPLSQRLNTDAVDAVPVNATVGQVDPSRAVEAAVRALSDGYRAVKLKVGVLNSLDAEVERVRRVRNAIGDDIEFRLDANGAWNLKQARKIADRLRDLSIAYLEQPLPPDDLAGAAALRSWTDIPIAADEASTTADAVGEIVALGAADVLIIKPGVVGGLRRSREIIEQTARGGIRVVITSAMETGVGIAAALHLAATLPRPVPACGLATGSLLETDLLAEPLAISDGCMRLPAGPGLGVRVAYGEWTP